MAKIVSLSRIRKTHKQAKTRAQADENAVKFGQTKSEKSARKAVIEKAARGLDGHRRQT